jgi:predicted phage terminase large subunit-like protein
VKCRRVVKSDQYQRWFGDSITLVGDSNQKTRFDNTAGGYRIATSVSGEGTGHGGDIIVADDPHNVKEGESDKKREEVLTWWDEAMSTRLNNPKTGRKVIIQQRVHENDLAGHVLEAGGYDHLDLPARFERDRRCVTSIGWSDPRQDEGEPLWAERFGEAELSRLEKDLGPYGAAAQLQQRPSPREGGMIKRAWFPIISRGPSEATWIRYWDLAATEKTAKNDPDRTAGALLAYKNGLLYIEDIIAVREGPANVEEIIKQTARMDGRRVKVWMEQEPGASGKNTIHHYRKLLRGYAFDGDRTSGPKESYVDILAGAAKAGDVLMVEGEWNAEFLREAEVFPFGAHDDMLDSVAKGYAKLTGGNLAGAW